MEFQTQPFDVDTVFVKAKKKQTKKLRGPDSPLYMSIWPMVYVVRVFGLAPYDFSQDRLVPSNVYLIFSATVVILYTYIFYVVAHRSLNLKRTEGPVLGGTENTKVNSIFYIRSILELNFLEYKIEWPI